MTKHYDLTRPPKFLIKFFEAFRKWRLGRYKRKKVREEKSVMDRDYFIKFRVVINDPVNPQVSDHEYEMVVPAKAAFHAKRKTKATMVKKMAIDFIECEPMTKEQYEDFRISKVRYERENKL